MASRIPALVLLQLLVFLTLSMSADAELLIYTPNNTILKYQLAQEYFEGTREILVPLKSDRLFLAENVTTAQNLTGSFILFTIPLGVPFIDVLPKLITLHGRGPQAIIANAKGPSELRLS